MGKDNFYFVMEMKDRITDAMRQYEKTPAEIIEKPKRSKVSGVKRPDGPNIIASLAGLFEILAIIAQIL